jgi:uncharacterized RDD family membrane protein YckC
MSLLLFVSGLAGYMIAGEPVRSFAGFLKAAHGLFPVFFFFSFALVLFYFTYLTAYGEKTLGKALFGIRVVRRRDGENIGFTRALIRTLFYWVSAFPLFIGFLMAFLLKGMALHDMLTGTMVIKED